MGAGRGVRSARNGHPKVRPERSAAERRTPLGVGAESTCDKMGDHVGRTCLDTALYPFDAQTFLRRPGNNSTAGENAALLRPERVGIDEALGDVADAAAVVHAPRASGIFMEVYDVEDTAGGEDVVPAVDVAYMVAVSVDAGLVRGQPPEGDAGHYALLLSARMDAAQAAARASTCA